MTSAWEEAYKRAHMGRVLDIIFPLECIGCGAAGTHACPACLASIPLSPKFFDADGMRTVAGFAYAQPFVRRLLHDAKYERWTCALEPLETLARRSLEKSAGIFPEDAVVMAVPLHPSRLRSRGFNQAETLARAASAATRRKFVAGMLERVRTTRPQTDTEDRHQNVRGAFTCRKLPESLRERHVILVDDVRTSGATMGECAATLRSAGAGQISGFALAWGSGKKEEDGT